MIYRGGTLNLGSAIVGQFFTRKIREKFFSDTPRSENGTEPPFWTPGAPARGGGIRAQLAGAIWGRPPAIQTSPLAVTICQSFFR